MGNCQQAPQFPQSGFINVNNNDQIECKKKIDSKIYPTIDKNILISNTNHGPCQNQGQFTGLHELEISSSFKKYIESNPFKFQNGIIQGEQMHPPFIFVKTHNVYMGQWTNHQPHGVGRMQNIQKNTYFEGYFFQGLPYHTGRFISEPQIIYQGQIKYGLAYGKGILKEQERQIKGNFKNNSPHGTCVETTKNYRFQGQFDFGEWSKGILTYYNQKCVYKGQFKNGLFNGKGQITTPEYFYKGDFISGDKHGEGYIKWDDKTSYKGQWVNGYPEGQGNYMNSSGLLVYQGTWKKGKAHQIGVYMLENQLVQCRWQQGIAIDLA